MIGSDPARPPFPVTLDNWQSAGQLGWTFQHMAEIFPTATISRGTGPVATPASDPQDLGAIELTAYDGSPTTVADVLAQTETDGWLVLHRGRVVTEQYGNGLRPNGLHLLMSVSKSIVGCVVGALAGTGTVEPEAPVTAYVPELADSGYAGATVRHLLDMRSGIGFSENYLDPDAEVRRIEQAFGWAPRRSPDVPVGMRGFLRSLRQQRPHGGFFSYRSCETDVLGWVCEAAAGRRFPELAADLVWSRIGAEFDANIGVDGEGTGMFDGGISATIGDLARFGLMLGRAGRSATGEQVVPAWWLADSWAGGPDSRDAFAASPDDNRMPGGQYRNQFWFPYPDRDVLLCLGIHGQLVYVEPARDLVVAKLSSWPTPQHAWKLFSTLAAIDAVGREFSSRG